MSSGCDSETSVDCDVNGEQAQYRAAELVKKLESWVEANGHFLNPDAEMLADLAAALLVNEDRYGYMLCPCREADGRLSRDLDIICPCDYRDQDIAELNTCFCGLFVSEAVRRGDESIGSIPERRAAPEIIEQRVQRFSSAEAGQRSPAADEGFQIWRCRTCGYICERSAPPLHCPVCLEGQDQFETNPLLACWS